MTVYDNVAFGLELQKVPKNEIKKRVMELLEITGLSGMEKRYPNQLSGGQRQRVAFARALAPNPQVLLLDEPFSGLDPALRQEMLFLVADVCEQQQHTLLMVSHSVEDAARIAPRSMVVAEGRIVWDGATAELLSGHSSASHLMGISAR